MNGDLESTLKELGPEYRDVVARLRSARDVEPSTKHQRRRRAGTNSCRRLDFTGGPKPRNDVAVLRPKLIERILKISVHRKPPSAS